MYWMGDFIGIERVISEHCIKIDEQFIRWYCTVSKISFFKTNHFPAIHALSSAYVLWWPILQTV